MSAIETQEILSEDTDRASDSESLRLVPVAESIRYRKRAQSAEKKIAALTEELAEAKTQAARMSEELNGIRSEQELTRKLACSGAVDLEAAVLLAKAKVQGQSEADLDGVVEQLKKEKQYLFAEGDMPPGPLAGTAGAKKTSGVRDRVHNKHAALERAAKKAATTGNRADLQEYLKLRRSFM